MHLYSTSVTIMGMRRKTKKPVKACYTEQPNEKHKTKPSLVEPTQMNTLRRISSDFLIAEPSFGSGIARLVDFGCAFDAYNKSATPAEADFRATLSDWISVGFDILDAADLLEQTKKIA